MSEQDNDNLSSEEKNLIEISNSFSITTNEDLERAGVLLNNIKFMRKKIEDVFNPMIEQAHKAHKMTIAKKKEQLDKWDKAEQFIKSKTNAYLTEQRRLLEEQKRADIEAERKKAEEARKEAERHALEHAQLLDNANHADAANDILESVQEDIKAQQERTDARIREIELSKSRIPTPSNIYSKTLTKFRIVDVNKINPAFLIADEQKIRGVVNAMKKEAEQLVGGIEVYEETITVSK